MFYKDPPPDSGSKTTEGENNRVLKKVTATLVSTMAVQALNHRAEGMRHDLVYL